MTAHSVSGQKSHQLWGVAGVLLALAVAWWIWAAKLAIPAAAVINILWFLIPLVTVSLVAILVREQRGQQRPAPVADDDGGVPKALLNQIERAISDADWEDYTPSESAIEKNVAVLQSAFTSLRKQYGFETPRIERPHSKASLILGVNYLRRLQPFLLAGHVEEAREAASAFVKG